MKAFALLAFVAFVATLLPNSVEAVRCYSCSAQAEKTCEDFDRSSAEGKKAFIEIQDDEAPDIPSDCTKCNAKTSNGKVIGRGCSSGEDVAPNGAQLGVTKGYSCDVDLCNGGDTKSFESSQVDKNLKGRCYICGPPDLIPASLGIGTCDEFGKASADERKKKFTVNYLAGYNCKKCTKGMAEGKVVGRNCLAPGVKAIDHKDGTGLDVCEGDLCNGAGSLKSWTAVALLATVVSLLKGHLF